jgi:hypothetical protein
MFQVLEDWNFWVNQRVRGYMQRLQPSM